MSGEGASAGLAGVGASRTERGAATFREGMSTRRSRGLTWPVALALSALVVGVEAAATSLPVAGASVATAPPESSAIKVYFRNNKGWFKPITLIYYVPGDDRGQIESRLLLPWQRFSMELPTGTKVYVASAEQVERWRAGSSLRHLPAAMTIRDSDAGELYNLFR